MQESVSDFFVEERGQDVLEYSLLLAFVVVSSAALLLINMSSIVGIWSSTNELAHTANSVATSGTLKSSNGPEFVAIAHS